MSVIVTGDDIALPVTLKKDGKTFVINPAATVKAAIVSADHASVLAGPVTVSALASGSDWARSLIIVQFSGSATQSITANKPAKLEIEVNDGGKLTWFTDVRLIKGLIT